MYCKYLAKHAGCTKSQIYTIDDTYLIVRERALLTHNRSRQSVASPARQSLPTCFVRFGQTGVTWPTIVGKVGTQQLKLLGHTVHAQSKPVFQQPARCTLVRTYDHDRGCTPKPLELHRLGQQEIG